MSGVEIAGDHLNAERFLYEHGEDVRYVPEMTRWLVWNGNYWGDDRLEDALELARATIDGLRTWVGDAGNETVFKRRARHYEWSTSASRREGMLAVARTTRSVAVRVDDLDRDTHLLACKNGTVDLRDGSLGKPDRGHLITRGVNLDYSAHATSEAWSFFLKTIFAGDDELIAYVQRLAGYIATGETSEHLLPIFWGTGANGKSTFIAALQSVLGEHAMTAPEGLLVEGKHEQHPSRLATLRGRRLVVSSELEQRAVLAESLVKSITGGDRISARHMYGSWFEYEPSHTLVLVTNHMPRVRGTDEAIWRRLRLVPFTVTIPPEDRIPDYGSVLGDLHGDAILAWFVQGAVGYYRYGLADSQQVQQATAAYRGREDVFRQWLDEATVEIRGRSKVRELQGSWREWAKAAGASIGRNQDFVEWLESRGFDIDRGRTSYVRGVGLLSDQRPDQQECTTEHHSPQTFQHRGIGESYGGVVPRGAQTFPAGTVREIEPPIHDDDLPRLFSDEMDEER